MAPIPWFGPFLGLGIGVSAGSLVTQVDGLANERLKGLTYHIPVSLGFAIGRNHAFEVALSALYHPAPRNAGGSARGEAQPSARLTCYLGISLRKKWASHRRPPTSGWARGRGASPSRAA